MYIYSLLTLVFLFSIAPVFGEDCGPSVIQKLKIELGTPVKVVPAQLQKLNGVSTVTFLGRGDGEFGGMTYLVTFTDEKRRVFKIYNYVDRGSRDLAAMTRLRLDQEGGKDLGFKIPVFKQRRDLGPQVMELEHIEGKSLEKILLADKNVDFLKKKRLEKIYEQKVRTLLGHLQANYNVKFHAVDYPIKVDVSSRQLTTQLEILIKHDNIIVTPNEEMYFVDPY